MPRNGSGNFSLPAVYLATPGTTVRSEQHNVPLQDMAQALTDSLPRNGSAPMTGNLPMGGRRITGVGAPTQDNDAARRVDVEQTATTTVSGRVTLATPAEVVTGTNAAKVATPAGVKAALDASFVGFTGAVVPFYRLTAPDGWLLCNGADVSRSVYAALWAVMGSPNTGDGSTTFTLPDLRAEFVRGMDAGRGVDTGRVLGSPQAQAIQSHNHGGVLQQAEFQRSRIDHNRVAGIDENYATGNNTAATTGPTGGTETRPRNVALLYCIKT